MRRLELRMGLVLTSLVILAALVSLVWTPFDPTVAVPGADRFAPPGWPTLLGTDWLRRDVFSRLLTGSRACIEVGIISVSIAAVVGVPLGIVSAMMPTRASEALMRAVDIAQAFPALLLAILLAGLFGGSTVTAMVAIGVATIPQFVRIARAGSLQVLASDYVLAARACGTGRVAIARTHVLPNIASLLGVQVSVSFAMAILAEAALAYLGLGTQPPTPTWGAMLKEAQPVMGTNLLLALWPGAAIAWAVLGFNLLADGLRELLDPRLREVA